MLLPFPRKLFIRRLFLSKDFPFFISASKKTTEKKKLQMVSKTDRFHINFKL